MMKCEKKLKWRFRYRAQTLIKMSEVTDIRVIEHKSCIQYVLLQELVDYEPSYSMFCPYLSLEVRVSMRAQELFKCDGDCGCTENQLGTSCSLALEA